MEIAHDEVQQNIQIFSDCTGIPVTVYDQSFKVILRTLPHKNLCCASTRPQADSGCRTAPSFAAQNAYSLGEPYIYSCDCGFIFLCVALLTPNGQFSGCQIAGPIRMEPLSQDLIATVLSQNPNCSCAAYSQLMLALQQMPENTPAQIESLSKLFYNNVTSLCRDTAAYERNRDLFRVQNEIGENIFKYKTLQAPQAAASTQAGEPAQLIALLFDGHTTEAFALLEYILQRHLSVEDGSFERIKLGLLKLYMDLCRAILEKNRLFQNNITIDFPLVKHLSDIQNVHELFAWSHDMLKQLQTQVSATLYDGYSDWIVRAMQYIQTHYMEKLTLQALARTLHVHASYLSKLFKKDVGMNFTDYLNAVRIEQSIRLLSTTDKTLLEIASAVGFEDQSYFTKIFRKVMGETPKKYRTRLTGEVPQSDFI